MKQKAAAKCVDCRLFMAAAGSCKAPTGSYYGRRVIMPAREISCGAFVKRKK